MGHSDSVIRLPSCGSVSAGIRNEREIFVKGWKRNNAFQLFQSTHIPSRIFCSSSSNVGSISSQPSGGRLRLLRTLGIFLNLQIDLKWKNNKRIFGNPRNVCSSRSRETKTSEFSSLLTFCSGKCQIVVLPCEINNPSSEKRTEREREKLKYKNVESMNFEPFYCIAPGINFIIYFEPKQKIFFEDISTRC